MKKFNASYLLPRAGIPATIAVVIAILAFVLLPKLNQVVSGIAFFVAIGIIVTIPMQLESKMKKIAAEKEKDFPSQGFAYQYKFQASNAVYYIDQGGKMGVIYCYNPTELQFVDLNNVTNVRVNDGKFGAGTSRVCCEFLLEGKKVRITTLKVSRGTLSMKDKRVLEAISKADQLCSMLNTAKANAKA
ncbi:MAG: hypothetical protein J1E34_09270 [Oscillospiraceae bacterium]|nr:hypothetical protein [Oscillospiraceae bacterium]